jgi:hypothetical protein
VREFTLGGAGRGQAVGGAVSPQGKILYALYANGELISMDVGEVMDGGKDVTRLAVLEAGEGPSGLQHHPHMNLVGAFGRQGVLKIWTPQGELNT